jgi:hypothetical protein
VAGLIRPSDEHCELTPAGPGEQAGRGHRAFAVTAHHYHRLGRKRGRRTGSESSEFDVRRSREVTGRVLVGLPDIEDRPIADRIGADHRDPPHRSARFRPRAQPTGQLAGDAIVADLQCLPGDFGRVLVGVAHEHQRAIRFDQPAQPSGKRGP